MRILITGSTGLIGTNLVEKLRDKHEVFAITRQAGLDLRDKESTKFAIETFKPEIVYHLAANAAESRGQVSPIDMTENNLNILLHVLVPSINCKVKRFIYTSSIAVYGEAEVPYSEDDIPKPKDVYGVNKLAGEQIIKILSKVHGFDYTIFRPHNVYGPHQDMANPYKNVVALFMRAAIEETPVKLFGKGKMKRAFTYVDDLVGVLEQALDDRFINQTVNVGSLHEIDIATLVSLIEKVSGKTIKKEYLPARPQEIYSFLASHTRQRLLTEYKETPIEEGLKRTWDYLTLPEIKVSSNEIT